MAIEIGTIKTLIGTAVATASNGSQRTLKAGDSVFQDEVITTGVAGAIAIELADGSLMTLGRDSQAVLDTEVYDPSAAAQVAESADSDVDAIQQALLDGTDPTQVGEATAAGAGTQTGGNEGHQPVVVDYLAPEVQVTSGFDSTGVTTTVLAGVDETVFDFEPTAGITTVLLDEDNLTTQEDLSDAFLVLQGAFQLSSGLTATRAAANGINDDAEGDDLAPNALTVLSGTLAADFGGNGAGDIVFNAGNTQPVGITSGGEAVQYWVSEDGYTLIGYTESDGVAEIIMTAQITDVATGAFQVALYGPVDHADGSTEDNLTIDFGFTVSDSDGDTAEGTLRFDIDDDTPVITATQPTGPEYEFTITNHDHESSAGHENSYGYYIKDSSGQPTAGVVVWDNVKDSDTTPVTISGQNPDQVGFFIIPNGNTKNDDLADNTAVTFKFVDSSGSEVAVGTVGGGWQVFNSATDTALEGTRANVFFDNPALNGTGNQVHVEDNELDGNQNWEDLPNPGGDADFNDVNVNVEWSVVEGTSLTVDETELADTDQATMATATMNLEGAFGIAFGADGAAVSNAVSYELGVTGLSGLVDTATGDEVMLSVNGGGDVIGYVSVGNTEEVVFTLSVDENGVATLTQSRAVVHDDPSDHDEATSPATLNANTITLSAIVTDGDGDTATDNIDIGLLVAFEDDGPVLTADIPNDIELVVEDTVLTTSGNVLVNDILGADGGEVTIEAITGTYGSVTISANGDYIYELNNPATNVQNLAEGEVVTDNFGYTVTDGDGDTAQSTLTITVTGTNDAPEVTALTAETNEDTSITFTEADLLLGTTDVDNNATLNVVNISLSTGTGTLLDNGNDTWTYTPGINSDVDAVLAFDVSDGIISVPNTMAISVIAVADAPNLQVTFGDAVENTVAQTIDLLNVDSQGNGFVVTAYGTDGSVSTISKVSGTNHDGFGVNGGASGASSEIGSNSSATERLQVDFSNAVSSIKVNFAWLSGIETAAYTYYLEDNVVGSGTTAFQTDQVDGEFVLDPGAAFDRIDFTAPLNNTDDYLVNSITFDKVESYSYEVTAQAALTDTDGSETLAAVELANLPVDVTYIGSTLNSDTAITPEQLNQITLSVISTETNDGSDSAITIIGGAGDDDIFGGAGDDIISGGAGDDSLFGGDGADEFVWNAEDVGTAIAAAHDVVSDFNAAEDTINLSDLLSDGSHTIEGIDVGTVGSEHLQLNIKDTGGNVVQEIELNGVAAGADVAATLQILLDTNVINDGT